MMILRVLAYLALCGLGFYTATIILVLAVETGAFSVDTLTGPTVQAFKTAYLGTGIIIGVLGMLVGLGHFFTQGWPSRVLMAMPVLLPALYSIGALLYFS